MMHYSTKAIPISFIDGSVKQVYLITQGLYHIISHHRLLMSLGMDTQTYTHTCHLSSPSKVTPCPWDPSRQSMPLSVPWIPSIITFKMCTHSFWWTRAKVQTTTPQQWEEQPHPQLKFPMEHLTIGCLLSITSKLPLVYK